MPLVHIVSRASPSWSQWTQLGHVEQSGVVDGILARPHACTSHVQHLQNRTLFLKLISYKNIMCPVMLRLAAWWSSCLLQPPIIKFPKISYSHIVLYIFQPRTRLLNLNFCNGNFGPNRQILLYNNIICSRGVS